MAFNAARQSFASSAVITTVLAVVFAMRYHKAPYPVEKPFTGGMPPAGMLTEFSVEYPWLASAVTVSVLLWILFILIQLTVRYTPASGRNYIPIQFFMIAGCGLVIPGEALASYVAALLLILSTRQFISSFRKEYRFEEAFRAGFYLGFIPLLYAPGISLFILIPIAMSLYRRSSRELAVCLAGALIPVIGAGFIYWAVGEKADFLYKEIWRCIAENPQSLYAADCPATTVVCAGLILLFAAAAVVWSFTNRKGMRTKQRKVISHVAIMLVIIAASAAMPGSSVTAIPLTAVPVAIAVPHAFSGKLSITASTVYFLILIAVLTLNLTSILGISIP